MSFLFLVTRTGIIVFSLRSQTQVFLGDYPDCVQLDRIDDIKHWFTESARGANKELGDIMVEKSLEYLEGAIV